MRRNTHKPWPDGGEVFDETLEIPVKISDPDRPIGTHIFTAMAASGTGLRWTSVSIENANSAQAALDRITIPQDVINRFGATALPRSSIVISDEPLSRETNFRTEFVAVLSDQPQGGFITRRPTVTTVPVASNSPWGEGGFFSLFDQPSPPRQVGNVRTGPRTVRRVQQGWSW